MSITTKCEKKKKFEDGKKEEKKRKSYKGVQKLNNITNWQMLGELSTDFFLFKINIKSNIL